MLGSSIIELWVTEDGKRTKTVFTGDLGNNDIPLIACLLYTSFERRNHKRRND